MLRTTARLALIALPLACTPASGGGGAHTQQQPGAELSSAEGAPEAASPLETDAPAIALDGPVDEVAAEAPASLSVEPMVGVGGSWLWLTTNRPADGCGAANTCRVEVGGLDAEIVSDVFGQIVAVVPAHQPVSGDVCFEFDGHTDCVAGFEVLERPVVESATVTKCTCRCTAARQLTVLGVGFPNDAQVSLDGVILESWASATSIYADIPDDLAPGLKMLVVRAPSHGRCGTPSAGVEVLVE